MKCTANTHIKHGWMDDNTSTYRCIREIGHPGLHCYYPDSKNEYIQEFPDSQAFFPRYAIEE